MSRKIICISDIHNSWVVAESIAAQYENTHTIVFTGDYFDNFGDTIEDAIQTAQWLKESLQKPNRVHILGNHDINYSFYNHGTASTIIPQNIYNCSGYTPQKDAAINKVLTKEDWDKIKLYHIENGFIFTHAGIHPYWFECPVRGTTVQGIKEKLDKADECYRYRIYSDLLGAAGRCRGGNHRAGGVLWLDFFRESQLIPGIRQVFGHTPTGQGIIIEEEGSAVNINIDCGLSEVLEIHENGGYTVIKTGFPDFYFTTRNKQLKK